MKVVILAGGRGSRLSEETTMRPKPLVEIGDKPILWHIMSIYAHFGFDDFVICAGYKSYQIKEYFANLVLHHSDITVDLGKNTIEYHHSKRPNWKVTVVDTGLDTMTGGRLKRIRPFLNDDEPFLMTYGDGVADIDINELVAFHRKHGKLATVTAVRPPARFGALAIDGDNVLDFMEKPQIGEGWVNGGFFVLEPGVNDYIDGDDTTFELEPLRRIARDGQLMAYRHPAFWQPMDTLRELRLLRSLWDRSEAPWQVWR